MLVSPASFAAVAVTFVGLLIVWANPGRSVNRLVFSCSLHISTWLAFIHLAITSEEGLVWLRWATSVSALIPLHFFLVMEAVAGKFSSGVRLTRKSIVFWGVPSLVFLVIPFTDYFIPPHSTGQNRLYGRGYYAYIFGVMGLYLSLGLFALRRIRALAGGEKMTLQVWLGGGCASAATILGLMWVNAVTHDPTYIRIQPFVVIVYYAATSIAITTHRIFDARQLILIGVQKCLLVLVVASLAFGLDGILGYVLPEPFAFLITTALMLGVASKFNSWLDYYFNFYPQATAARVACIQAFKAEARIEKLEAEFSKVLRGWGQSEEVFIAYGEKVISRSTEPKSDISASLVDILRLLRWATPERLAREKPTPERQELARFLERHGLGVLVIAEGPSLTAVIGVGVAASRRPYTYPQVTQLMELASIMESALERAHFSAKVQHAEQLATVGLLGASMAHEIRNPLVSIKTFVQLLPTHYQDPAFREKFFRLIGSEVSRIDQLTEQLLDLSTPRTYAATRQSLHAVLQSSLDLVTAKAADQGVEVRTEFLADPDAVYTDAAAARQVMLNLCFNAIQAVEAHESAERWIRITTRNTDAGVEMVVTDNGPGIAPEMQQRLFQPFQTTKSSGFGLGLAICRDILANLGATITVDPSVPAAGATFRVVFPCQASSS